MSLTLSQRKRAAIVQAAIDEFKDAGYDCSNMDSIAARAQVSKRTVYNHFESKAALFHEISMQLCESCTNVAPEPFDPSKPMRDQLIQFAKKKIAMNISPEFTSICKVILPERLRNPELSVETFERIRSGDTGFDRWLADAIEAGALQHSHPDMLSRQFTSLILEFAFWPQFFGFESKPNQKECNRIAESTVDLFLKGCGTK